MSLLWSYTFHYGAGYKDFAPTELVERDTTYGRQFYQSHLAIAIPLPELLSAGERLNRLKVRTYNCTRAETTGPSVIGWMPSAQLYFRDPDGHTIEFITLRDENPDSEFTGSLGEWQRRTGQSRG
jgi:catechol 2,3-dioxygenase-like lactoylglutathione lyase family enzyme